MTEPTPSEDGNPPPATPAYLAPVAMQDIRHLLFEQGKRLQSVLEVQGKQNAAFQQTLTGITQTMADRTQGGTRTPIFPDGTVIGPRFFFGSTKWMRSGKPVKCPRMPPFVLPAMQWVSEHTAISMKSRLSPGRTL